MNRTLTLLSVANMLLAVCAASTPAADSGDTDAPDVVPQESLSGPTLLVEAGHTKPVTCAAFSLDSRRLATGSDDNSVRIWDVESGDLLLTLNGHNNTVVAVCFSPDGRSLLTGGYDKTARLWDSATGKEIHVFKEKHAVRTLGFSPDGRRLLIVAGRTGRLCDPATFREICRLVVDAGIQDAGFAPDGRSIVTATGDLKLRLWDADSAKELRAWDGRFKRSTALVFSADGRQLLSADSDHTARLWNVADGNEIRSMFWEKHSIEEVGLSPDGRTVYLADGNEITAWDVATGQITKRVKQKSTARVERTRLLKSRLGYSHYNQKGSPGAAFSRDGRWAAMWNWANSAVLADLSTGKEVRRFNGALRVAHSMRFAPDGRHLLADIGMVWDLAAGRINDWLRLPKNTKILAFVGDGRRAILAGPKHMLRLYDSAAEKTQQQFGGQRSPVLDCCVSPDGQWLATGSGDKTVRLWDIRTGRLVHSYGGHGHLVSSVRFAPDSRSLLSGSEDGTARLWNVGEGAAEVRRFAHAGPVWSVGFSADGRYVLTAGGKTARLWETETGREFRRFVLGHALSLRCAAISADGKHVATGGESGKVRVWDVATGKQLYCMLGHHDSIAGVSFSPDSARLLSTSFDNTARLWNVATGQEMATLVAFRNGDWAVIDPQRRYDGSNAGNVAGLHWVVEGEYISLDQLKDRFYEPGLLAKITGFNREPLGDVSGTEKLALYPEVEISDPTEETPRRSIRLSNRGGGIGRVVVRINGKVVSADARGPTVDPQASEGVVEVSLAGDPRLLPGEDNVIEVQAYNAAGYLRSRGMRFHYLAPGQRDLSPPQLWAIVAGSSQFRNPQLDLNYAAKDAEDFAAALQIAGERFCAERVHVRTFSTLATDLSHRPTRGNLERAFAELVEARAQTKARAVDVLVVYLAGHGVSHRDQEEDFYYLTCDGNDEQARNPATRISGADMRKWINDINLKHQVLILDTCAAGRIIQSMTGRDVPSSQERALEQLKDSSGLHILAGCAANAKSYETSEFGHGLLTHSLLMGMSGGALRDGEYVDVLPLFNFAVEQVAQLASQIDGMQRPQTASPMEGSTFPIGRVAPADRKRMPVQSRHATVVRSNFQDEERIDDVLQLARQVDQEFRERSTRPKRPSFVDASETRGAYRLSGRYHVEGTDVIVEVGLLHEGDATVRFPVRGSTLDLLKLVRQIADEAERRMGAP